MTVSPTQGGNIKIDQNIPTTYPTTSTLATGTSVTLEAVPALGYEFAGWSGSLTGQNNPVTIEMTCPKNITANFTQVGAFRLTVEVIGGGTVTPSAGSHGYTQGTVVNITAIPNTGYNFDGWTGDVANANSSTTTVTVDTGKTIIANFSRVTHILTLEVKGSGSVSPSAGDHTCTEGSRISITATPNTGYQFTGWTGEVEDATSATTIVTVNSDMTVTANFVRIRILTLEVKGNGSVNMPVGLHMFPEGTVLEITATPDEGYRFTGWTGAVTATSSASTTVTVDIDKIVTANFAKATSPWLIAVLIAGGIVIVGGFIWIANGRRKSKA